MTYATEAHSGHANSQPQARDEPPTGFVGVSLGPGRTLRSVTDLEKAHISGAM
jgi:hypothetical protein